MNFKAKEKKFILLYSIFFRENAELFVYISNNNYPIIFFKKYDNNTNSFDNYFSENKKINLGKYNLNKTIVKMIL